MTERAEAASRLGSFALGVLLGEMLFDQSFVEELLAGFALLEVGLLSALLLHVVLQCGDFDNLAASHASGQHHAVI